MRDARLSKPDYICVDCGIGYASAIRDHACKCGRCGQDTKKIDVMADVASDVLVPMRNRAVRIVWGG